jgi:lipopolysaccharide transport system ATP-binding protein
MSDTVIRVENLSKKYIIRHQQAQQYTALRDVIADGVKSIGRRLSGAKQDPAMGSTQEEFWALKDVSFEVKQGDRIGIIGRNGAGKSTLLKILSRITEPTTGEITLNGRVASLLEVGTGFHPELTGRENIFLNGSVLGMGKAEINRKFDEIVAFAEVEKFLDTPVKRYSSGMYVRLAFAVAAHLEPEILIVDEVLAVGDAVFQKKCLEKMDDVAEKEGRTVLFVSHNMSAVKTLCKSAIFLEKGEINLNSSVLEVVNQYHDLYINRLNEKFTPKINSSCYISDVKTGNRNTYKNQFTTDEHIEIYIKLCLEKINNSTDFLLFIHSEKFGGRLLLIEESLTNISIESKKEKEAYLTIKIPPNFLMSGAYNCEIGLLDSVTEYLDHHSQIGSFNVIQGENSFIKYGDRDLGIVFSKHHQILIE